MLTLEVLSRKTGLIGDAEHGQPSGRPGRRSKRLYSAAERLRRDTTRWTLVQGILAPIQFVVFLVSLALVAIYLATDSGAAAATVSVIVKTLVLYAIMITGSIWEKAVFGRYLFAPAFFWEDVVGMLVIGLHTAYLICLATQALSLRGQMLLALAAYTTYVANATQFILKLRTARREVPPSPPLDAAAWAGAQ